MAGRARTWLTWTPPLAVALFLLVALRFTGSGGAADPPPDAGPVPTTAGTTADPAPGRDPSSPPTTGFASREPVLPTQPFDYRPEQPAHLAAIAAFDSSPPENPVTDAGATLGRVLFYDVNLSRNRTIRCASCHVQAHSFTDPLVLSQGVDGLKAALASDIELRLVRNPSTPWLST
ncbi:MAG: cytochrome c peroxidase, partial [Actinomycetota bacterium]